MNLQLLKGTYTKAEALDIVSQFVQVKIKFHENKIEKSHQEEDVKMREARIKQLQLDFSELKKRLSDIGDDCTLDAEIKILP